MSRALATVAAAVLLSTSLPARAQSAADLFDRTVVHDVRLFIHSGDWDALKTNFRENTYYPCDLVWKGQAVHNAGVRSRGYGSRSSTKPALRLDFSEYSSGQRFLGLKSLALDNLVQDPSMLRERLAMRVFERMGMAAPREAFARLYVNNELIGLYTLVEPIDKQFLSRAVGQNDGYLYEYNWVFDYYFQYLGATLEAYAPLFTPKTHEQESASQLYGPIEAMVRTANQAGDAGYEQAMSQYVDVRPLLKHLAVETFLAEHDGILGYAGMANFYLYRYEGRLMAVFLPWDKDRTFAAADFPIFRNAEKNVLVSRLLRIGALREYYLDMLDAAATDGAERADAADPASGWLAGRIASEYSLVREAARLDPSKPFSNDDFEASVTGLREFARTRSRFVHCEVARARGQDSGESCDASAPATR